MIIPTSWTNTGLTWDAPNPMWTLAELTLCMIEAIKEKCEATGGSVPNPLFSAFSKPSSYSHSGHEYYYFNYPDFPTSQKPYAVYFNDIQVAEGAYGSLQAGQWAWHTYSSLIIVRFFGDLNCNTAPHPNIKIKYSVNGDVITLPFYNPIRPNRDYVNAIHSEVSALIPLFVNHTDHGGDYNGQTAIPTWTEATILTAIGDPARIIPSNLNVLSPWYFQTRKILDLLRWVKLTGYYEISDRRTAHGSDESSFLTVWNEEAIYWQRWEPYYNESGSNFEFQRYDGDYNYVFRGCLRRITFDKISDLSFPSFSFDSYYLPQCADTVTLFSVNGAQKNLWHLMDSSLAEVRYAQTIVPGTDSQILSFMFPAPTGAAFELRVEFAEAPVFILKFDGANGFRFRE